MNPERVYQVLRAAHVSEKANKATEANNQYVFKVALDATKSEVRNAVQTLFKVEVEAVTTIKVKGKVKRTRRGLSRRAAWKKAYVRLAPGHAIEPSALD